MRGEGFVIDHVIHGVVDIDAASARLREEFGLGSVPGSPHLGGTVSRIVPLGPECFLELLGIDDTGKSDGASAGEARRASSSPSATAAVIEATASAIQAPPQSAARAIRIAGVRVARVKAIIGLRRVQG